MTMGVENVELDQESFTLSLKKIIRMADPSKFEI